MQRLCVFCGSSNGRGQEYLTAANDLGKALASLHIGVVYGGARIGLMGAVANAALAAGGEVLGVIPKDLTDKEIAHQSLTKLHVVNSMHERKAMMAELADGFIALPGGFGTCEEVVEVLTWAQLGLHGKPVGLLNVKGYYDPLLSYFTHGEQEGFIAPVHRKLLLTDRNVDGLIAQMREYRRPSSLQLFEHWQDKI